MLTNLLQDEIERAGADRAALCRFRRSFDTVAVGPRLLASCTTGRPKAPRRSTAGALCYYPAHRVPLVTEMQESTLMQEGTLPADAIGPSQLQKRGSRGRRGCVPR